MEGGVGRRRGVLDMTMTEIKLGLSVDKQRDELSKFK